MQVIMFFLLCLALVFSSATADITGSNPVEGSCICLTHAGVNVRDEPCGSVIASASTGQCYKAVGSKQNCQLSGVYYDFFAVEYGSTTGWMAGSYLNMGEDSDCASSGAGTCAQVERVYRSEWGARDPHYVISPLPNKPVGMAFVHHTVTGHCTTQSECEAIMRSIQNYHMDSNGWADIGYNWLVGEDGRAYEGRQWDKIGAHTYGYNDVAVAVSVIGDYTNVIPNTAAQAAIRNILDCAIQEGVLVSNYEMFGHRDAGCTACPGDSLYPLIETWPEFSDRDIPKYCKKK